MHVDTCQVKLDLETYIDIRSVNRWRPPKCEPSIGDLIETRSLRVRELLKLHRFFEA
jgi:hypothetical protein